jgi:hypothetical protein
MKKIVGFIGLAFLHLMIACSSMALGNTPMATDGCKRFQKRRWQMGGPSDFKRPQSAKLRSGDSRH